MIDDIGEVFAGGGSSERQELHGALDDLLDAAEKDGGRIDPPAFWAFVAAVAEGRGIAEQVEESAVAHVAEESSPETEALDIWRSFQAALSFILLRHLGASDAHDLTRNAIIPQSFDRSAVDALLLNLVRVRTTEKEGRVAYLSKGDYVDLFGLRTSGGEKFTFQRTARRLLVSVVFLHCIRTGESEEIVRGRLLGSDGGLALPKERTWENWKKDAALSYAGETKKDRIASMRRKIEQEINSDGASPYDPSQEKIEVLWSYAYAPGG